MRLTPDVIQKARVSINPLKERELDLRGYKIACIENLGITKDTFDCFDLSDNEIKKLENFPKLLRLRMLLCHNNLISKIAPTLNESIPHLEVLMLTNNQIRDIHELVALKRLPSLIHLSLAQNPVTKHQYYREYIVYLCPQIKTLDFQKIKQQDKDAIKRFFHSAEGQKVLQSIKAASASFQDEETEDEPAPPSQVPPPPPSSSLSLPPPPNQIPPPPPAQPAMQVESQDDQQDDDVEMEVDEEEPSAPPSVPLPSKPISQLKVAELRDELSKRGLSTTGKKAELLARLKEALEE